MLGLIIAGIAALIAFIATTTAAAVALSQEVQTATYVNQLSKNVTLVLGIQEDIVNRLEHKVNALYEVVQYLGDEVHGLKIRPHLKCHAFLMP